MCDYCDCRSHPQIGALSADHDVLLGLLAALSASVKADDARQARDLVSQLDDLLHGHARREERGVFTQLRREVRDESYVAMFEHDHQVLHGLLEACAAEDWQRQADKLIGLLREHIVREETDLFPVAHQMLEPQHWTAVDTAVLDLAATEVAR